MGTVAELRRHGDFGLGTFEGLDGEMLALDGCYYRIRVDGEVSEARDDARVPFADVTLFRAERETEVGNVESSTSSPASSIGCAAPRTCSAPCRSCPFTFSRGRPEPSRDHLVLVARIGPSRGPFIRFVAISISDLDSDGRPW